MQTNTLAVGALASQFETNPHDGPQALVHVDGTSGAHAGRESAALPVRTTGGWPIDIDPRDRRLSARSHE